MQSHRYFRCCWHCFGQCSKRTACELPNFGVLEVTERNVAYKEDELGAKSAVPSFQPPAGEPALATANSYLGASH